MKKGIRVFIIGFWAVAAVASSTPAQSRRDQLDQPEKLLDVAGIEPGMTVGEAGAGSGYLTFFLSRRVGTTGRIYANDIDEYSLRRLNERSEREGVNNITTVLGDTADPKFPVEDLDVVIMLFAFHDFTEKTAWLRNVKKYMKDGASVFIFDGQDHHTQIDRETVNDLAREAGFLLARHEHLHNRVWLYELHMMDGS